MKNKKMKYCDHCQNDVEASIVERSASYSFKGETFELVERVLQCSCGEDLHDELLDSITMKKLVELYEDKSGLSLEKIKSIRSQYGLSMDLFSRVLGWSKATIARYETGKYIPDSSHMYVLKSLQKNPEEIDDFFKRNKHKLSEQERNRVAQGLSCNDKKSVEKGLENILKINYKLYEKTVNSGYSPLNLNKFINMVLFFTQNGIQKTKLMKLLFYSDFLNYKRNLISMAGIPYIRLTYGPVPKDHDLLLSTIEKSEYIDINYEFNNEYTYINIKAKKKFDETLFNDEEIDILHSIKENFKGYGSVAISEYSHKEKGWLSTEDQEVISYDYANSLSLK